MNLIRNIVNLFGLKPCLPQCVYLIQPRIILMLNCNGFDITKTTLSEILIEWVLGRFRKYRRIILVYKSAQGKQIFRIIGFHLC